MERIIANIFCELTNEIPDLEAKLSEESAMAAQFLEMGILEHAFVKPGRRGAVLVFKDIDETQAQEYILQLPLASYFTNVDYHVTSKAF